MGPERFGNWIIDRELGRGGMGQVYLAHADSDKVPGGGLAAVKVLDPLLARETGFLERFEREIAVLRQLDHPNIVHLYESGTTDGRHYFAMEYVDGRSLSQDLEAQGRLPWPVALDIALQACPALKHAHDRGIVHRDLKPSNLLRTATGMVKLTDFGIARVFGGTHLTATGAVLGTAEYLAPEQAAGKPSTKRSDLYALGTVLYHLLTGRPPFEGELAEVLHKQRYAQPERPQRLVPSIPHDLDNVVCQLLEKDPEKRPGDASVLLHELDRIRRKLERKAGASTQPGDPLAPTRTHDPETPVAEQETLTGAEGPATLMSRLMRRELEAQNRAGPVNRLLNRPIVLIPLFLLTVALIAWALWPQSAEKLYERTRAIMSTNETGEYAQAAELMDQLDEKYPGHPYGEQLRKYREQIAAYEARREVERTANRLGKIGDAQWFYMKGMRFRQEGREGEARRVWQALIHGFGDVPDAQPWVRLAESRLADDKAGILPTEQRWKPADEALERARRLRDKGKLAEARVIWQALEDLYREDPSAREVLAELQRDRASVPR